MGFLKKLFGGSSAATANPTTTNSSLGLVRGRHYTEWIEEVKQLKRDKNHHAVIELCSEAVGAIEAEYRSNQLSVAPWWYEQVAMAARRSGQPDAERAAMQRYLDHPGRKNPEYVEKFDRFIAKLDAKEGR